jgi:SAM-dependent methyltransferase
VGSTVAQVNGAPLLPAGLLVQAPPPAIVAAFAELCALQPVRMGEGGLVCAPRAAPDLAAPALARCPLPTRALADVPGWPDPPAAMVAGWYRRGPGHLPAPAGVRELVQAPGEGFGPGGHATTAMCLEAIEGLAPGRAVDAGCGSGLLAQAWARLGRGPVIACDLDPRAVDQAARSLAAAALGAWVDLRRGPLEALAPEELAGVVLMANLPAPAHRALLRRIGASPAAAVLSGLRPAEAGAVADAYCALGLRPAGRTERGGFCCLVMAR